MVVVLGCYMKAGDCKKVEALAFHTYLVHCKKVMVLEDYKKAQVQDYKRIRKILRSICFRQILGHLGPGSPA